MCWIILISSVIVFVVAVILFDLFCPGKKKYVIYDERIGKPFRFIVFSDFHCRKSILKNNKMFDKIKKSKADGIFLVGDMITSKETKKYWIAEKFIEQLSMEAPVYYSLGNHESRCQELNSPYHEAYMMYIEKIKKMSNVFVLDNEKVDTDPFIIAGLTIEHDFYLKKDKNPINLKKSQDKADRKSVV